ncbi:MAG: hypothetical protein ACFFCG_03670 [Promethearchaeota archaeon]
MESRLKKKLILITLLSFTIPFVLLTSVFTAYFLNIAYWQDDELLLYEQPVINSIVLGILISLIISLIVGIIFFLILRKKYSKEEKVIISFQDKIKDKTKIEIEELRKLFTFDKAVFYTKLLEWVERYKFTIDGDYILTNDDNILEAIDSLEAMQEW